MTKLLLLICPVLYLAGCTSCPHAEQLTAEPYTTERTAGSGIAYKMVCIQKPDPRKVQESVNEKKHANKVFKNYQKK